MLWYYVHSFEIPFPKHLAYLCTMDEIHEKLNHANPFDLLCLGSILLESRYIRGVLRIVVK